MNPNAIRGTCLECGRYVVTYARKDETAPRARTHKSLQGAFGTEREWKDCPGSNNAVRAS